MKTNEKIRADLLALAAMMREDARTAIHAVEIIENAAEDVRLGNVSSARNRIVLLLRASNRLSSYYSAFDYAVLAQEALA